MSAPKRPNYIYYIILGLGVINLALAAYDILSGNPFEKYMFTLLIGAVLTGSAFFKLREKEDKT